MKKPKFKLNDTTLKNITGNLVIIFMMIYIFLGQKNEKKNLLK